jgi:poly(A) polymerase
MSNHDTERITWLVKQHMRVATTPKMRASKLKRLVREDGFNELLELFRIDCIASHNKLETHQWLKDYADNLQPEEICPQRLLTGRDLIAMGYPPSALFKEILIALEDAQLEGQITNTEEARTMVRRRWAL